MEGEGDWERFGVDRTEAEEFQTWIRERSVLAVRVGEGRMRIRRSRPGTGWPKRCAYGRPCRSAGRRNG
jgi:hypothetical protein